jgi:uncharacterized RDD family membrane protein YckC
VVQVAGNWVCADCKPAFLSRVMASGVAGVSERHYGGFWIRFGARMIDGLIFVVPFLVMAAVLIPNLMRAASQPGRTPTAPNPVFAMVGFLGFLVITLLMGGCYEVLMLKYRSGTVGKLACGLKVIRSDGQSLGWGVCFGRFFMWNIVTSGIPYLNMVVMLVSSIMLGVDDEKRALHDRVCDTRVIYK